MPSTGGRPDIGYTTQYNTVWLMTQDNRAARIALAQSDTSGAIPWNYKLPTGQWLTPNDSNNIWTDGRGGPHGYTAGIANIPSTSVWTFDNAHQPNLNYVPYLMTGQRWNLDRLNAQAAANLVSVWPKIRCLTNMCATLLNGADQLRGQAWGFREIKQAAFIGPDSSEIAKYFKSVVADNWIYVQSQLANLRSKQGEVTGWFPAAYGTAGVTAEWQQDFLTGMIGMAALMGDSDAKSIIAWQKPWLVGRFTGNGMNPRDGCIYNLMVTNTATGTNYMTWAEVALATASAGMSNGSGWSQSNGYYCTLAMSSLNIALTLSPTDNGLLNAQQWLSTAGAPLTDQASHRNDPTFNLSIYK